MAIPPRSGAFEDEGLSDNFHFCQYPECTNRATSLTRQGERSCPSHQNRHDDPMDPIGNAIFLVNNSTHYIGQGEPLLPLIGDRRVTDDGHSSTGKKWWCDVHGDHAITPRGQLLSTYCNHVDCNGDPDDEDDLREPHGSICSDCFTLGRGITYSTMSDPKRFMDMVTHKPSEHDLATSIGKTPEDIEELRALERTISYDHALNVLRRRHPNYQQLLDLTHSD